MVPYEDVIFYLVLWSFFGSLLFMLVNFKLKKRLANAMLESEKFPNLSQFKSIPRAVALIVLAGPFMWLIGMVAAIVKILAYFCSEVSSFFIKDLDDDC